MAFPASWPPRAASGIRSIRFYATGSATANFSDNAFMFAEMAGANTFVPTPYVPPGGVNVQASIGDLTAPGSPMGGGRSAYDSNPDPHMLSAPIPPPPLTQIWGKAIRVINGNAVGGAAMYLSFDGATVQGVVLAGTDVIYWDRYESGIAIKGSGTFYIEAW